MTFFAIALSRLAGAKDLPQTGLFFYKRLTALAV